MLKRVRQMLQIAAIAVVTPGVAVAEYGQELEADRSPKFFTHDGEVIALLPSERYLAAELDGFDLGTLNNDVFTLAESSLARKHGLALIRRNPNVDDEAFRAASNKLGRQSRLGEAFSAGGNDLILVNDFIVHFESEWRANQILRDTGAHVIRRSRLAPNRLVISFPGRTPGQALDAVNYIAQTPGVEYAYPNFINIVPKKRPGNGSARRESRAQPVAAANSGSMLQAALPVGQPWPDDFWFASGYQDAGLGLIKAPAAWEITTGGCNVKIAVLDDGVDMHHKDLEAKIIAAYDAIEDDDDAQPRSADAHGTASAGVVAAVTHNRGRGIAGTIWGGSLIPIRIFESGGEEAITQPDQIYAGIEKALELGADVLSNSWGLRPTQVTEAVYDDIADLIEGAIDDGHIFVFAVGNGTIDHECKTPAAAEWPASLASEMDLISVGSTDHNGMVLCDSKAGPGSDKVTIVGPGGSIVTTDISGADGWNTLPAERGDYYEAFGDSSAAAPFVAGAAALLLSWHPGATPAQIRQWLMDGAVPPKRRDGGPAWGSGLLDVFASLKLVGSAGITLSPSLQPATSLSAGQSATLQVLVSRNGTPLSGAMVRFAADDENLATVQPANAFVATDCDGVAATQVTGMSSSSRPTETFISASVNGVSVKASLTVGASPTD